MPPALLVRLVRLVTPPTAALKSVAPVEFAVRLKGPLTAPVNEIPPLPVETVVLPARVVVPATLKALLVVVYVPASVAASPYCWAPVVVTDCRLTVPPALLVRLVRLVTPPTAALKSVAPVEFAVRLKGPLTAPVNEIPPLPVETVVLPARVVVPATLKALLVVVYVPASVAASPYCWAPVVVTDCRLTVPPVLVVRLVRGVDPPTAPPKVVTPAVFTVRDLGPSTAPENVIAPEPEEASATSCVSVTAPV